MSRCTAILALVLTEDDSEQSNQTNKSRLKLLQTREQHLQSLFDATKDKLDELTADQGKYKKLLTQLILQGLLQLMESKVTVTVKSTDVQMAQEAAKDAEKAFKDKSGRDTSVTVQEGLDKASVGGLILAGHGGKITINNTLEERLRLLEDRMLPEIRLDLFGPNQNRKYVRSPFSRCNRLLTFALQVQHVDWLAHNYMLLGLIARA